jgi:hypothetical protein
LGLPDHTGSSIAGGRVLHVNLFVFKYGTDDKAHAAAMVLSILFLIFIAVLSFAPSSPEHDKLLSWLESALLLTVGVAIGQGISAPKK